MIILDCKTCNRGLLELHFVWEYHLWGVTKTEAQSKPEGILYKAMRPKGQASLADFTPKGITVRCPYCKDIIDYEAQGFVIVREGETATLIRAEDQMARVL